MHLSTGKFAFVAFSDIYRSSHLWEFFPREYAAVLGRHKEAVEQACLDHGGEILKGLGDGYLLLFSCADDCLGAVCQIANTSSAEPDFPDGTPFEVRLACHAGFVNQLFDQNDYFGPVLNAAARISQVCHPGQTLVSADVLRQQENRQVSFADLGVHYFRDLAEPLRLYQICAPGQMLERFPDLNTSEHRPTNLRADVDSFVGRKQELQRACELLRAPDRRLVSIIAPGGYGKTRLASSVCQNLLNQFEQGVFEVQLAELSSAAQVPVAIADAVGLNLSGGLPTVDQLVAFFKNKRLLLYLDNFEHVLAAATVVTRLLEHAPEVKLLVTSREPMHLRGETILSLKALGTAASAEHSPSEAAQLFLNRASLLPEDIDLAQVESICSRLYGIPLAIELTAAWLDVYSPLELLDRLDRELEIEARAINLPQRHGSLRSCIEWSFNLLDPELQELLLKLSVFRGGFSLDAVRAIVGDNAELKVSRLIDKCWLEKRSAAARFTLRDVPTFEFLTTHAVANQNYEQWQRLHCQYSNSVLEEFGQLLGTDQETQAVQRLRLEAENIDSAIRFAASQHQHALGAYLWPWGRYLLVTGQVDRYLGLLEEVGPSCLAAEDRAEYLLGRGTCLLQRGEVHAAQQELKEALSLTQEEELSVLRARALNLLGHSFYLQQEFETAETLLEQSRTIFHDLSRELDTIPPTHNLAITLFARGLVVEAYDQLKQCLTIKGQSKTWEAAHLHALRYCAVALGNLEEAKAYSQASLLLYRELGNLPAEGRELLSLAETEYYSGDPAGMRSQLDRAQHIADEIGDDALALQCHLGFAQAALMEEDLVSAGEQLSAALNLVDTSTPKSLRIQLHVLSLLTEESRIAEHFSSAIALIDFKLEDDYGIYALTILACALSRSHGKTLGRALLDYCSATATSNGYKFDCFETALINGANNVRTLSVTEESVAPSLPIEGTIEEVCCKLVQEVGTGNAS